MAGSGTRSAAQSLRIPAIAGAASGFPEFGALDRLPAGTARPGCRCRCARRPTTPRFFSCADEHTTLARLTEIILPSDDGPGARKRA